MDALIAKQAKENTPAVGNMRVNAKGDKLGPGGEIVQKNEDRVRAYYRDNPRSSTSKASLRGPDAPPAPTDAEARAEAKAKRDAAKADKLKQEATKTKRKAKADPIPEPDEFDAPAEPLGYKEVELPNGDIEMVPYYKEDDA
jgi:hypothetical protein